MMQKAVVLLVFARFFTFTSGETLPTVEIVTKTHPVNLDVNTEYSLADLEKLHDLQASIHDKPLLVNVESSQSSDELVKSSDKDLKITKIDQNLSKSPVNIHQKASISYLSECPELGQEIETFIVDVSYDGKHVYYDKKQNIDYFGFISVGGGYGKPITSAAKFDHFVCRSPDKFKICSYSYSGTITSEITSVGSTKQITVDAYGPNDGLPDERAKLIETCSSVPRDGSKIGCPGVRGPPCTINHVYPVHKHF